MSIEYMQHPDEYTLELFVLDAPEVQARRGMIQSHLKKCEACRVMAENMSSFYTNAEIEMQEVSVIAPEAQRALMRQSRDLAHFYDSDAPVVTYEVDARVVRWKKFVRRNKVGFSVGSLGVVVAFAFVLNSISWFKDTNPIQARFNNDTRMLEVYNKSGEQLWGLLWFGPENAPLNDPLTVVTDLDEDGKNEVITVRRSVGTSDLAGDALRIFDARGSLKVFRNLGRPFKAMGKEFEANFSASLLLIDDFAGDGQKEIIVGLNHVHSPYLFVRLDARGRERGEYWHYGHLSMGKSVDLEHNGKKEMVVGGMRDVSSSEAQRGIEGNVEEWRAAFVVLDPSKILGQTQASATPVFGFPLSQAETHYVTLPRTDIDAYQKQKPRITAIEVPDDKFISFWRSGGTPDGITDFFQFMFSHDLHLLDVKTSDETRRLQLRFFEEGKIKHRLDAAYFDYLKRGVRYWNGKEWRRGVVRVELQQLVED